MDDLTRARLFGWQQAFDDPAVRIISYLVAGVLVAAPVAIGVLQLTGRLDAKLRSDLVKRYLAWLAMVPIVAGPVLLGAAWTMALVLGLALVCYREFARATGLFREKAMSLMVVVGILLITFAVVDHWYGLFVALPPLTIGVIAAVAILGDRPVGYIQRVALASLSFLLFGVCLGHLAYLGNDTHYRALVLLVVVAVQMNDVFAYCVGKSIGGPKLAPRTSPNKTIAGALGALVLTTAFVYWLSGPVFAGTALAAPGLRLLLGIIVSVAGQLGDLMISSVKRDVGVKDTGALLPGHGGVLDRCNSLLLASPAVFHFVGYFCGVGYDQPARIISG